ncbi:LLM class F420-dependent oxidoreductase [Actinoplanes sp. GCM10030250]|uniref:LLM class F420-dependent oxidoreductase n=1 Tax=Actinoplanes sp. GCM10030250 TaxID=3273376 RepID=UPI0036111529
MRLGTAVTYAGDPRAAADEVAGWERSGLDVVWVSEAYGFDAPTAMGYLAARTERVEIGSSILPLFSRTPALLAQTAAGLDALSRGRAILGLGASGPQVIEGWHGVPYDRPVARTRETIEICRAAWRREVLVHDGLYPLPLPADQGSGLGKPLKMLTRPVRDRIPIHVAALGDRNVRMTAEVADGWHPFLFLPEKASEVWGDALAAGTARRSAGLGPLDVVAGGALAIGDDVTGLRDLARPLVALYVGGMGARGGNFYHDLVARYGYQAEADKIQELYLAGRKAEAAAAVPADLLERTSLIGPDP